MTAWLLVQRCSILKSSLLFNVFLCLPYCRSYRLFVFLIGQDAKMSLCCTFEMAAEICHFEFDPTNILWVLTASKEEPLTCLKWANTKVSR